MVPTAHASAALLELTQPRWTPLVAGKLGGVACDHADPFQWSMSGSEGTLLDCWPTLPTAQASVSVRAAMPFMYASCPVGGEGAIVQAAATAGPAPSNTAASAAVPTASVERSNEFPPLWEAGQSLPLERWRQRNGSANRHRPAAAHRGASAGG